MNFHSFGHRPSTAAHSDRWIPAKSQLFICPIFSLNSHDDAVDCRSPLTGSVVPGGTAILGAQNARPAQVEP